MRVRLAITIVLTVISLALPALAADAPLPPPAKKRVVAAHYPTLEKMLRRFSRQAGESRTRG
jgi:hypothetical protein